MLCKENGFPSAISAVGSSHFGRGSGPIHLDDVDCSGQETSIFNCRVNQQSNCDHSEDAGVVCESPGKIFCELWKLLVVVAYMQYSEIAGFRNQTFLYHEIFFYERFSLNLQSIWSVLKMITLVELRFL